jgi:predicted PurR-regulated permease PerM
VPVRTIAATIGMVLLTVVAVLIVMRVERILIWLAVSVFLTTALWPLVGLAQRRLKLPRSLAVTVVFLLAAVLLVAIAALFITPLVTQGRDFVDAFPGYVADARAGRGPVGSLVGRFHLDSLVQRNEAKIRTAASGVGGGAAHALGVVASTLAGIASIVVLTFLMLLEGPKLLDGSLNALAAERRERVVRVGRDCAHAVTGYIAGNLVISVICGLLTFIALKVFGVPYAGVVAVFVAVADLIPLVGATIGAIAAVGVAFLSSTTAGIAIVIFFLVYQQLENHLLQPVVLSRTVKINPLAVLVSILVGVELAGILGALLAIPVAGIIQVLVRDFYDHRRGVVKSTPTVGEDETPVPAAGPVGADAEPYPAGTASTGSSRVTARG